MRQRAIARGLRLNEYGLFKSRKRLATPKLRGCHARPRKRSSPHSNLPIFLPNLREDHGEFAAAERGEIPRLIEWTDLRRLAPQPLQLERPAMITWRKSPITWTASAASTGPLPITRNRPSSPTAWIRSAFAQQIKEIKKPQPAIRR